MLVGLPGRLPGQPLHAEVTSGTLLLSISGPGVESVPLTARGMECISSVSSMRVLPLCHLLAGCDVIPSAAAALLPTASVSSLPSLQKQRFMVGQVAHNVELEPVGRVCLVQQLQSCMPVVQGLGERRWRGPRAVGQGPARVPPKVPNDLCPTTSAPPSSPCCRRPHVAAHRRRLHSNFRPRGGAAGAGAQRAAARAALLRRPAPRGLVQAGRPRRDGHATGELFRGAFGCFLLGQGHMGLHRQLRCPGLLGLLTGPSMSSSLLPFTIRCTTPTTSCAPAAT